jgi:hypothetical protein
MFTFLNCLQDCAVMAAAVAFAQLQMPHVHQRVNSLHLGCAMACGGRFGVLRVYTDHGKARHVAGVAVAAFFCRCSVGKHCGALPSQ